MNTATHNDPTTSMTANLSPKEAREMNLLINGDKPKIPLPGNTFPIRGLLWVLGATWNKEAKVQEVPEHSLQQAQEALAHVTKLIEDKVAARKEGKPAPAKEAKPTPAAKVAKVVKVTHEAAPFKSAAKILAERKEMLAAAKAAKLAKQVANG
jgi:hypothetical protein